MPSCEIDCALTELLRLFRSAGERQCAAEARHEGHPQPLVPVARQQRHRLGEHRHSLRSMDSGTPACVLEPDGGASHHLGLFGFCECLVDRSGGREVATFHVGCSRSESEVTRLLTRREFGSSLQVSCGLLECERRVGQVSGATEILDGAFAMAEGDSLREVMCKRRHPSSARQLRRLLQGQADASVEFGEVIRRESVEKHLPCNGVNEGKLPLASRDSLDEIQFDRPVERGHGLFCADRSDVDDGLHRDLSSDHGRRLEHGVLRWRQDGQPPFEHIPNRTGSFGEMVL